MGGLQQAKDSLDGDHIEELIRLAQEYYDDDDQLKDRIDEIREWDEA
jgi:hypothetical protein